MSSSVAVARLRATGSEAAAPLALGVGATVLVGGLGAASGGYFPASWGWVALALLWVAGVVLAVRPGRNAAATRTRADRCRARAARLDRPLEPLDDRPSAGAARGATDGGLRRVRPRGPAPRLPGRCRLASRRRRGAGSSQSRSTASRLVSSPNGSRPSIRSRATGSRRRSGTGTGSGCSWRWGRCSRSASRRAAGSSCARPRRHRCPSW